MDALAGEPSLIPGGGIQVIGGIEKGREGKATEGAVARRTEIAYELRLIAGARERLKEVK